MLHLLIKMLKIRHCLCLLSLMAATVAAQEDCPDAATECPDSCAGEQCARFLNAECQENPCFGLCAPNFFGGVKM